MRYFFKVPFGSAELDHQGSGRWWSTEAIFRTSCASASPAKSPCAGISPGEGDPQNQKTFQGIFLSVESSRHSRKIPDPFGS